MEVIGCSKEGSDGLWYTVHMKKNGIKNKMDEYTSIMLAHNQVCHERRIRKDQKWKKTVCGYCYSYIQSSVRHQLIKKMERNSEVLRDIAFKPAKIKTINGRLRYISFGDVSSEIEVKNILKHARYNPTLKKAVWTKMYGLFKNEDLNVKRMIFIWSCSKIDCLNFVIPKGFNKSFYVFSDKESMKNGMERAKEEGFKVFECKLQCNTCNRCYDNQESEIIFEVLR